MRIERPTRFKSVLFPDRSFWHNENGDNDKIRYYTKEYVETVDAIRNKVTEAVSVKRRRVYLTRSGWKQGCVDFGEDVIEAAFAKFYGCEIVRSESLSIIELVRLMHECEVLVTTDGSVVHNTILGPNGLNLVMVRKSDFVNYHQPMINLVRDLNVTYVDAYSECEILNNRHEPWVGPFYMYVRTHLVRFLRCGRKMSVLALLMYFRCKISLMILIHEKLKYR